MLTGCSVREAFSFGWPRGGITPQSEQMFNLWIGSDDRGSAVGVLVWGLIFWCVIRYRKRGDGFAAADPVQPADRDDLLGRAVPHRWSVLFYYTAVVQTDVNRLGAAEVTVAVTAVEVELVLLLPGDPGAGQPARVHDRLERLHPGAGCARRTSAIRVRGAPARRDPLVLVPALLFKRDVFPGNVVNRFETTILTSGAYVGRCAELCGTYHSMMNFELRAVTLTSLTGSSAAKRQGLSTPEALASIGQEPRRDHDVTASHQT